jgi:hypothetical protein
VGLKQGGHCEGCTECDKDFEGNTREHNTHSISNMIANFWKHHLHTNFYICSLCQRLGLLYTDHPQSEAPKGKAVILSNVDHERLVKEGTDIMHKVNGMVKEVNGHKPFFIVGNRTSNGFKFCLYHFKVCCCLCGDFFQLCPLKKNLEANLINHIQGYKHKKAISDSSTFRISASSAISTRWHGQPSRSKNSV